MSQDFYVIRDLNRNLILGLDWLKQNNVRIYFDLKCLRINGKHYVNLEEDIHIASTVRMKRTCLIKPQTASICYGKVRENPALPVGQSYEISQIEKGFIVNQPGLQIIMSPPFQGWETYCFSPGVRLSVRLSVCHKSCPLCNLKTP